jgi:hypothetical protein
MLRINKDKGLIMFSYSSDKGVVQGRISYFKNMLDELTFNLSARTVPVTNDVQDIGTLLNAIGQDLVVESLRLEKSGPS